MRTIGDTIKVFGSLAVYPSDVDCVSIDGSQAEVLLADGRSVTTDAKSARQLLESFGGSPMADLATT